MIKSITVSETAKASGNGNSYECVTDIRIEAKIPFDYYYDSHHCYGYSLEGGSIAGSMVKRASHTDKHNVNGESWSTKSEFKSLINDSQNDISVYLYDR